MNDSLESGKRQRVEKKLEGSRKENFLENFYSSFVMVMNLQFTYQSYHQCFLRNFSCFRRKFARKAFVNYPQPIAQMSVVWVNIWEAIILSKIIVCGSVTEKLFIFSSYLFSVGCRREFVGACEGCNVHLFIFFHLWCSIFHCTLKQQSLWNCQVRKSTSFVFRITSRESFLTAKVNLSLYA